ncbi:heterokaryon incompatibility protein-domain-containing protein [Massariosphaeria phaeospora]|uniref:Heterokaryon incompatibility protein-domain-containing protein n=1 Tax=Massariosphaeria phaeospora TaxID=100035 RepID=A0A7C8I2F2_9PLEO|nr:heterokaryon incompatibility protein-domain-containing protein [Massariosphaeria phaeospora]
MRLIHTTTLHMQEFMRVNQPYAILSHTWGAAGDEVSYHEMIAPELSQTTLRKPGYVKIAKCCEIARKYGLEFAWVDTCCIDKSSSAELTEEINSMYKWYEGATVCIAYLADLTEDIESLRESRWFTRGWTLQELVAPGWVEFYDQSWANRGNKTSWRDRLSEITGISPGILHGENTLDQIPVAVRMSWASKRETTRDEDMAYCLLGIFDINMPMLYGEGSKAFLRLQEEIIKQ